MAHSPVLTLPIREVIAATPRSRIVRLDLGRHRFDFRPGQSVMIGQPGGRRRPYSVAAAPHDSEQDGGIELLVGTDGNTAEFQRSLVPGAWLELEGPVGSFTFDAGPGESRFAFVAGGTGIAPIRSMLRHALRNPRHSAHLLYVARSKHDFAYDQELHAISDTGRLDLRQSITRGVLNDGWTEGRGRPTHAQVLPIVRSGAAVCFICGPPAFVLNTRAMLIEVGMPSERLRVEDWLLARLPVPAPVRRLPLGAVSYAC